MIKWVAGVLGACVALDVALRYQAKVPEDTYVRPDGAPVRVNFWSAFYEDPVSSSFVRRKINEVTGAWGFSHCSIDAGEVCKETGERMIIDATPQKGIHRAPLSVYGDRLRVDVELPEVVGAETYGAARMLIGARFDQMEYLGPRRGRAPRNGLVCSTFVWHALPQEYREGVMQCDDGCFNHIPSPNQLAIAFGVPRTPPRPLRCDDRGRCEIQAENDDDEE